MFLLETAANVFGSGWAYLLDPWNFLDAMIAPCSLLIRWQLPQVDEKFHKGNFRVLRDASRKSVL